MHFSRHIPSRRRHQSGAALIAVLWLIAFLNLMIFTTVMLVRGDVALATTQKKAFRATQLAEMGIAIAANPTTKKTDAGLLHREVSEGERFDVKITGEGGKFNINTLIQTAKSDPVDGRKLLEIILCAMGVVDNEQRGLMIDNLINWVDADDLPDGSKDTYEKQQYQADGFQNYPFNRPFYNLDEMLLVKGLNVLPGLCPKWRDYFSIYTGGKLDVNEANAEMLAVAALATTEDAERFYQQQLEAENGGEPNQHVKDAQQIVEMRWGKDNIEDTDDDEKLDVATVVSSLGMDADLANARLTNQDTTTRIESTATVNDFRKRIVLVLRQRNASPQILMREEVPLFDQP